MLGLQRTWVVAGSIGLVLGHGAAAQVTTHDAGAVLVFPKVVADGTWDTIIQIANDANRPAYAHCYYVNGALIDPSAPPGPSNPPQWTQIDFPIVLTAQQPTHWVTSRGRTDSPTDPVCRTQSLDCDGAGFDPGLIPAAPPGFTGELTCIEEDASGAPWSGNALRGIATLVHEASGEVAKYPAIGLIGLDTNNADGTLCIGSVRNADTACPRGSEYSGCPTGWIITHPSEFDDRPVDGDAVTTSLTIVPCAHDFNTQNPTRLIVQFSITNELEQTFSAATTVTCWADMRLADINPMFQRDNLGCDWVQTRIRAAATTPGGFMVVQQTVRTTARAARVAAAATVGTMDDTGNGYDFILLPEEEVR